MSAHELTAEGLEAILARLGADREQAGAAYEEMRRRLIRLFEWRACEDAEALADETLARAARRIAEGVEIRAADPFAYLAGVARLVFKEVVRRAERERAALEAPVLSAPPSSAQQARLACLDRCLEELPPEGRHLLVTYYEGEGRARSALRARLAAERGLDVNALRVRVHRLREPLERCLDRCLEAGQQER